MQRCTPTGTYVLQLSHSTYSDLHVPKTSAHAPETPLTAMFASSMRCGRRWHTQPADTTAKPMAA